MIVCDFCKKRKDNIDTLVLYSQTIDYCKDCEPIVIKLKKQLKKSIKYYEDEKDRQLKQTEKFLIEKFKCGKKDNK